MRNFKIEQNNNGGYIVRADSERFGTQEIMFESPWYSECVQYILRTAALLLKVTGREEYIEIICTWMSQKKIEQLTKAVQRNANLTSAYGLGYHEAYDSDKGTYLVLRGCRSSFTVFINNDGTIANRAPAISSMVCVSSSYIAESCTYNAVYGK